MKAIKCGLRINEQKEELDNFEKELFPCAIYDNYLNHSIGNDIPWHWHEAIELIIVNKGILKLCCDDKILLIHANHGAFINANVLHSAYSLNGECCEFDSFLFHSNLLLPMLYHYDETTFIQPLIHSSLKCIVFEETIPWHSEVLLSIRQAFDCYENEPFAHELYVRSRCLDIWFSICQHELLARSNKIEKKANDSARIKSMITFIQENFQDQLTLTNIASSVAISEREALRCFNKSIGMTPIQYLLKFRIMVARRKLEETTDSITQVAGDCGFESPSYFTYIFKRFIGQTPSLYRSHQNDKHDIDRLSL